MLVFLDANVIFSAAQRESLCRRLIETLARHASLITHPGVWEEAVRNVAAKRPAWQSGMAELQSFIACRSVMAPCPDVGLPPKDQPVLGAAIALQADRLVTGDRTHFGPLYGQTISGVRIVSPRQMAE